MAALVQLFRIAAFVLFVLAVNGAIGWWYHWDDRALLGVIAGGLACLAPSGLDPPAPPRP